MINWSIQVFFSSPKKTPPTKSFRSPSPASASLPASAWSVFDSLIHWCINTACFVLKKEEKDTVFGCLPSQCVFIVSSAMIKPLIHTIWRFLQNLLYSFHQCFPPQMTTLRAFPAFPGLWLMLITKGLFVATHGEAKALSLFNAFLLLLLV